MKLSLAIVLETDVLSPIGRGFPPRPGCSLLVEGRIGGEVLSADPVILGGGKQEINTELAWEMTKRALQQHRLQRTPIKLQVGSVAHYKTSQNLFIHIELFLCVELLL